MCRISGYSLQEVFRKVILYVFIMEIAGYTVLFTVSVRWEGYFSLYNNTS